MSNQSFKGGPGGSGDSGLATTDTKFTQDNRASWIILAEPDDVGFRQNYLPHYFRKAGSTFLEKMSMLFLIRLGAKPGRAICITM